MRDLLFSKVKQRREIWRKVGTESNGGRKHCSQDERRINKRQMKERNEENSGKIGSRKDEDSAGQTTNPVALSQGHGLHFQRA